MSLPFVAAPAGAGEQAADQAVDSNQHVVPCLSEHATAGIVLMLALCVGTAVFVAFAVSSVALGALVGVLMVGVVGMAVVLLPVS